MNNTYEVMNMYTITVFEKVLDKLEAKMYSFDDKIEMAKFAVFAENEGAMVVMNIGLKLTV
ncbi:hypothetical protein L8C07_05480 [Paenibacillus sp. CMAA1739]|nr:hypothetical protein [Paenibacillus sp. CMAA1739]